MTLAVFEAAIEAGASHLSADGLRAYCVRYGKVLEASWKGREFGVWQEDEKLAELPGDAVKLE